MEDHARFGQTVIFGGAVVYLQADVAESRFRDGTKLARCCNIGEVKLKDLKPGAGKSEEDQSAAAPFEPEPGRHFRGVFAPREFMEVVGIKTLGIESHETVKISRGHSHVVQALDHVDRVDDHFRMNDRE